MSEITPLLNDKSDGPLYNTTSETEDEEREPSEHEAEYEIPLLEIVVALFVAWERNCASEDLTLETVLAMHLAYRRVTGGRIERHDQYAIMNILAGAMLNSMKRRPFFTGGLFELQLRCAILRNLRKSWPSIVDFDESIARELNAYRPTYREQIRNSWRNCERSYIALKSFFSGLTGQLLIILILLGWPVSLFIMGLKSMSQCTINHILLKAMVATGILGFTVLLMRLALACIDKWYWFSFRTNISCFWNLLRLLEFVFLLVLNIQLWFFRHLPTFDSKDPKFCSETFHSFTLLMTYISTAFGAIWLVVHFSKAVLWAIRRRFHYLPLFDDFS